MSPVFVKEFRDKNPCTQCSQVAASGRTMCRKHMVVAKDAFLIWSHHRREAGLCIGCADGKEVLTKFGQHTGRCKKHRAMNSAKCKAWVRKTGNYRDHKEIQNSRIAKWRAIGKCGNCVAHNLLDGDHLECLPCREMSAARQKGDTARVQQLLQERNKARSRLRGEALRGARERLRNLGYQVPKPSWAREGCAQVRVAK